MPPAAVEWDYLFVSDLHVSLGYDPKQRAYHPREDFFYDEAFFRWLRWADSQCAPGRRWELVFVGDTFDFLPVDSSAVARYLAERERRRREVNPDDPPQATRYWQQQFAASPPPEPIAQRALKMLFEDDLLNGRVVLEPTTDPSAAAPDWALSPDATPQAAPSAMALAAPDRARRQGVPRQHRAAHDNPAFEYRYGFLPTPQKSADKLTSIYLGHPLFFRALAWFVSRGHRLVFVRGNHDLELFWPLVQERVREFIAREYVAHEGKLPPDFRERIDFRPGWFHYRPGLFFAEHGAQYEPLDSCVNPIRPLLPKTPWLLNLPVGSLGVLCFHNALEAAFPEWENRGETVALLDLIRTSPLWVFSFLLRHGVDFLHMARRLWLAVEQGQPSPSDEDFAAYAAVVGLDPETVRAIYGETVPPLLTRRPIAWFLFSPVGHVLKGLLFMLALAALTGWTVWLTPTLAGLVPEDLISPAVGSGLRLLLQLVLWALPPLGLSRLLQKADQQMFKPFLQTATRRLHCHLQEKDPHLRFYIFGHDHCPTVELIEGPVFYLNCGSWVSWFARGRRRLQTAGRDVMFTFARLVHGADGPVADLLYWNDDAGRADPQIVSRVLNPIRNPKGEKDGNQVPV